MTVQWFWSIEGQDSFGLKEQVKRDHPGDYKTQAAKIRVIRDESLRRANALRDASFIYAKRYNHGSEADAQRVARQIERKCGFKPHIYKHSYI